MAKYKRAARVSLVAAACVTTLALSACGHGAGGMPPGAMGFTPRVTVVTLRAQPVTLTRELPGRTSAYLVAEVRPQVSGIVERRLFTEGAFVRAGQELYDLDDAIYRAQYGTAKASLQKAQATLVAARASADRAAQLVKIDAVSAQERDNAVATLGQAEADVAAAQAALDSSAVNLNYAHITSPISGRIGRSSVTQGALVTADQPAALATVQQLDPIYVDVNQSSSEWLQLRAEIAAGRVRASGAGTPVSLVLEDGRAYGHTGKLQFTDVTVDPATGNFLLRAVVPNPDHMLMPGMYVRARIDEGVRPNGVLAPEQAITRDPKGNATALVVGPDGKVEQRPVSVTRTVGNDWLVDEGLAAGERVIVEGLQKIQPGMTVQAVERAPDGAAVAGDATGGAAAGAGRIPAAGGA